MDSTDFSPSDLDQLARRGVPLDDARQQLRWLRTPPAPVVLDRPCAVGDGIVRLEPSAHAALLDKAAAAAAAGRVSKFVPASGAATRMFSDLIAAYGAGDAPSASAAARELFTRLDEFPFARDVRARAGVGGFPATVEEERAILRVMFDELRYADLPKGLVPFHCAESVRTAFEEHLLEGTEYARTADGVCRTHVTVPPGAGPDFDALACEIQSRIEDVSGCRALEVSYSEQHPSTDALALDEEGQPFRLDDGSLLFRPAGHGALLKNLQALDADIVVIKNIDNVLPFEHSEEVVRWKRLLIGYFVDVEAQVFAHLEACTGPGATTEAVEAALAFAAAAFARECPSGVTSVDVRRRYVVEALDRPLRVCGVVRNEGEPGGAPFWVREPDGSRTVQIVEPSQVSSDPEQMRIFRSATHFNPVDLVCGLRSFRGERFDLSRFADPSKAFVTSKSYEGRPLTALERPGLWNGGMAGWNTICVEVPASTFAPVKTVFDLLRPEHQLGRAVGASGRSRTRRVPREGP